MKKIELNELRQIILEEIESDKSLKRDESITRKFLDRYYELNTLGMADKDAVDKIRMELDALPDVDTDLIMKKISDMISGERKEKVNEFERPPINESDLRSVIRYMLKKRLNPS